MDIPSPPSESGLGFSDISDEMLKCLYLVYVQVKDLILYFVYFYDVHVR